MHPKIDLTSSQEIADAGFMRISAQRYLRLTSGDVLQRIELRANKHGGELTCDLTIHPLWARKTIALDVLEPGIWIGSLCKNAGLDAPSWYSRAAKGLEELKEAIENAGLPWLEANANACGIVASASEFLDPWRNEDMVHIELGHAHLHAGNFAEALQIFRRKPKRVPQFKTLEKWITAKSTEEIDALHAERIAESREQLKKEHGLG